MSKSPNFFLVGAPKAGTTSLYYTLAQHPGIYVSAIKEPCYFSDEIKPERLSSSLRRQHERDSKRLQEYLAEPTLQTRFGGVVRDWDDYLRLFANARDEAAIGEGSVIYLWSQSASENIARQVPGAKIIIVLREPGERAFSQYLHGVGVGAISWSFREHIHRNLKDRSGEICVHYPFLELGLYSAQVERYLDRFRQVFIGLYDDYRRDGPGFIRQILQFLDVDPDVLLPTDRRDLEAQVPRYPAIGLLRRWGIWGRAAHLSPRSLRPIFRRILSRARPTMEPPDRRLLTDFYREDVRKLAGLIGRDLSDWTRC
jgi:hypothetical protein